MLTIEKIGRVSDPVHGLIEFTDVERVILDHPVTQRLRYVSQSGLAHLVFPEVRTSRFSHSLGAMHLSSQFLSACLRNADNATMNALAGGIRSIVRDIIGVVADQSVIESVLSSQVLRACQSCHREDQKYVMFAEQALRLAALFHDIGHLPFSHDFEHAIEELEKSADPGQVKDRLRGLVAQQSGRTKIHERLGYNIALLLLQEIGALEGASTVGRALDYLFSLSFRILVAVPVPDPTPVQAAEQWLHSLMSGDLDVDRCDFLLRDGRNFGFEFASYNLPRLLDNVVVVQKEKAFVTAVRPQGLGPLESFLLARFRSYQYGVRHHKVSQVGAALRHSILRILRTTDDDSVLDFLSLLQDLIGVEPGVSVAPEVRTVLLGNFSRADDVWWMAIMRQEALRQPEDEWLGLVCWRRRSVRSLWKRPYDFSQVMRDLIAQRIDRSELHSLDGAHAAGRLPKIWNSRLPELNDADSLGAWDKTVDGLVNQGVLIVRHKFVPWESDPETGHSVLNICAPDGTLVPVSSFSPLARSLGEAWANDVQIHAFAESSSYITAETVLGELASAGRQGGVRRDDQGVFQGPRRP